MLYYLTSLNSRAFATEIIFEAEVMESKIIYSSHSSEEAQLLLLETDFISDMAGDIGE